MCETLQVSKSGYYDWVDRAPSARQLANEALALQIHSAFTASDDTYGMLVDDNYLGRLTTTMLAG